MIYKAKTAYLGEIASNYETDRVHESIWQKEQAWVETYVEGLPADCVILDIPVGTGRFLPIYQKKIRSVIGTDVSADMVLESKRKLNEELNYIIEQGDAEKLLLPDRSVDVVICFRLFHLIPFNLLKRVIREFYRVSKNEVIIQVFDSSLVASQRPAITSRLRSAFIKLIGRDRIRAVPAEAETPWASIENFSYSEEQLAREFQAAGFTLRRKDRLRDDINPASIYILHK